jgi:hypothetical protein
VKGEEGGERKERKGRGRKEERRGNNSPTFCAALNRD